MKFKSDDKEINQYMLHAVEISTYANGALVEFERGRDVGYAIIKDNKVVEIFVRDERELEEFKDGREISEIIKELNEEWLINKI